MNELYCYGVPASTFLLGIFLENLRSRVMRSRFSITPQPKHRPEHIPLTHSAQQSVATGQRLSYGPRAPTIKGFYSTGEAERVLKVGSGYLYNAAIQGRIKQHRVPGSKYIYYKKEDIEQIIAQKNFARENR